MDRHHEREVHSYPMEEVQIQPLEQSVSPPGRRESTQSSIRDRIIRFTSPVQLEYRPLSPLSNDKPFSDGGPSQGHSKDNSLVSMESKYSAIHPVNHLFLQPSPNSPPAVSPNSQPPLAIADSVKTWWGWWHPMFLMYVFFLIGVSAATGHHFYYASLHNTEVTDQFKRARYGAALSFVAKASLMASVILAFRQQMWATFRRKTLTVDAIDSIFAIMEDPTVMKWEAFKNAKVAMFLAFIVWISPLTVILTPGTLTVVPSMITNSTTCPGIRTLNFTSESGYDWRNPEKIAGLSQLSLSFYNTTSLNLSDPYWFDYYTAPTPEGNLAASLSAYTQSPIARKDIAVQTCGAGWNCSYEITFVGPGYKCAEYGGGNDDAPIETGVLVPQGSLTYLAHATLGEYSTVQIDSGISGVPKSAPPWPKNLGSFRTEPIIWVAYSVLKDENAPFPPNSSDPRWATAFDNKMFSCLHYETSYTVNFNYTAGIQNATVTSRKFIAPIMDTEFLRGVDANDGTRDNITAIPTNDYVMPQDLAKYRLTAAYHSLGLQLRTHINGSLIILPSGVAKTETGATNTKLIDIRNYTPKPDLMDGIQSLYEDMILSLLSNPQLMVVSWAALPSMQSGTLTSGPLWPCKKSRNLNVFDYRVRDLWLVYGCFIFLAAISILFGMKAVQQNAGHFKKNRFSAIVAATRGPELDEVAWRTDAHGRMPRGVGKTKLGYGIARQGVGGQRGSYIGRGVNDGFGEMFYRSEIDREERGV